MAKAPRAAGAAGSPSLTDERCRIGLSFAGGFAGQAGTCSASRQLVSCDTGVTPAYWIIDPDPDRPELTLFELGPNGHYSESGRVHGTTPFRALRPFAVEIIPARLVEGVLSP